MARASESVAGELLRRKKYQINSLSKVLCQHNNMKRNKNQNKRNESKPNKVRIASCETSNHTITSRKSSKYTNKRYNRCIELHTGAYSKDTESTRKFFRYTQFAFVQRAADPVNHASLSRFFHATNDAFNGEKLPAYRTSKDWESADKEEDEKDSLFHLICNEPDAILRG